MAETLVLLPGWGFTEQVFKPLREALAHSVEVQVLSLPRLASADPELWLQALEPELPASCWLGGWSLGGMLAAELAARRGPACAGLISLASNACFVASEHWPQAMDAQVFAAFQQLFTRDAPAALKRFAMLCAQGAGEPRSQARALQALALTDAEALQWELQLLAALDTRASLAGLNVPVLHLLAERDALLPEAAAHALGALAAAEVQLLPEAGHGFVLSHAEALAQRIVDFMGRGG